MNEDFPLIDTFRNRVMTLPSNNKTPNRTIIAKLTGTLPIMITNEGVIDQDTIVEGDDKTEEGDSNKLVDKEWSKDNKNEDRFIFMSAVRSAMTNNRAYFYYDNKYNDIIILPNIDTISLAGDNIVFPVTGFRLGSGVGMRTTNIINMISMDEADRVKLPKCKKNIKTMKSRYITMPTAGNNRSVDAAKITTYIQNKYSFEEVDGSMFIIIEMGTVADIFETPPSSIPVYLLYQMSLIENGIRYIGFKNTENLKLYVKLAF